jgi:hypothetical protein
LALGKRILVTSHKDPALAVLKKQIPEEIRSLVVSLLSSEQDGLKQFEYSIEKIASELQSVDKVQYNKEIKELKETLEGLHASLAKTDREISRWAQVNLSQIKLDGKSVDPISAAKDVITRIDDIKIFEDAINITEEFCPHFDSVDIAKLRDLRLKLGKDLLYVNGQLPTIDVFPDFDTIQRTHQDLAKSDQLQEQIDNGEVQPLIDSRQETFKSAKSLYDTCCEFIELSAKILHANNIWLLQLMPKLENQTISQEIISLFETLGKEIGEQDLIRKQNFIHKPINMSLETLHDEELNKAIDNEANGKAAFGLASIFVDKNKKEVLKQIKILGKKPSSIEDWLHIKNYKDHLLEIKNLHIRWNTLSQELAIPTLGTDLRSVYDAKSMFDYYLKLKQLMSIKTKIRANIPEVILAFSDIDFYPDQTNELEELRRTLQHHLTKNSLAKAWSVKEEMLNVLFGCSGNIVDQIKDFIETALGNPSLDLSTLQSKWKVLRIR